MSSSEITATTERQERIDGLRRLADWCEAHPTAKAPFAFVIENVLSREEMVAAARRFGGKWDKIEKGAWFELHHALAPSVRVEIIVLRQYVCERILTGSEEVEITGPDPELVARLPRITRTETVEQYEWSCPPSLLAEVATSEESQPEAVTS